MGFICCIAHLKVLLKFEERYKPSLPSHPTVSYDYCIVTRLGTYFGSLHTAKSIIVSFWFFGGFSQGSKGIPKTWPIN